LRTYLSCIQCIVRQSLEATELAGSPASEAEQVMRMVLKRLSETPYDKTPAHMVMEAHRIVRTVTGNNDPYRILKERYNRRALNLFVKMQEMVNASPDPFETAARLAIAGNIIDFGHANTSSDISITSIVDATPKSPLSIDHVRHLEQEVVSARRILYLTDNAGEIVFDRLFIEQIKGRREKVVVAVKGKAVINDATMDDAKQAGLYDIVRIIDTGCDAPGIILDQCSKSFQNEFDAADLIIAKGQGNYETLSSSPCNIYFLLKVKCPAIAVDLGLAIGDIIVKGNRV